MAVIETVCFDLDGTLCVNRQDDEDIHAAVFERVGREPPFTVSDVRSVDPAELPNDAESLVEFYEHLYGAVTDELGPAELRRLAEVTVDVVDETDVVFREGARAAFEDARDRFDVGVLTQGRRETQAAKLERLDVVDELDAFVTCGPGTGLAPKPDPEPFEAVLTELDARAESTLYVGNSLGGDVAGARGVGMHSAWVPQGDVPADPDPEPTYVLSTPGELPDVL